MREADREKTKKASMGLGRAFAVQEGFGTQYLTPFALRLGASTSQIGLLAAVPPLVNSLGQIFGAKFVERIGSRKKAMLWFIAVKALLWLPLLAIPFLFGGDLVLWLIFIVSLQALCGSVLNPAILSWFACIVRKRERGAFFGKRNEVMGFISFVSTIAAGWLLGFFEGQFGGFAGFALIFGIAFAANLVRLRFVNKMVEPAPEHVPKQGPLPLKEFVTHLTSTRFGWITVYESLFTFAVQLSVPFFAVYFLRELGYDYWLFAFVFGAATLATFLTMPYWGRLVDKYGNRMVLGFTAFLVACVPVGWIFFKQPFFLLLVELFGGLVWAGQRISTLNIVLESTPEEDRVRYIAFFNLFTGLALFAGALAGGFLGAWFADKSFLWLAGLPLLFFVSAILRFAAAFLFIPLIKDTPGHERVKNRGFYLKAVTVYPVRSAVIELQSGFHEAVHDVELVEGKIIGEALHLEKELVEAEKKIVEAEKKFVEAEKKFIEKEGKRFRREAAAEEETTEDEASGGETKEPP